MEHISKPLARLNDPANASRNGRQDTASAQPSSDVARRAARVWESMKLIYGTSFTSTYGTEPNGPWLEGIGELTDEQCAEGFRRLPREPRKFPPNLTEFMDACNPRSAGPRFLGVPLTEKQRRNLLPPPEQRATPEKIDGYLAKMRAKLWS